MGTTTTRPIARTHKNPHAAGESLPKWANGLKALRWARVLVQPASLCRLASITHGKTSTSPSSGGHQLGRPSHATSDGQHVAKTISVTASLRA